MDLGDGAYLDSASAFWCIPGVLSINGSDHRAGEVMSAAWIIYFASVSGNFSIFCGIIGFIALFISFVVLMASEGEYLKQSVRGFVGGALFVLLGIITPDKNTVYLIASAKVTEDIVKSPEAKEIGGKILTIINDKLDEQVKGKK